MRRLIALLSAAVLLAVAGCTMPQPTPSPGPDTQIQMDKLPTWLSALIPGGMGGLPKRQGPRTINFIISSYDVNGLPTHPIVTVQMAGVGADGQPALISVEDKPGETILLFESQRLPFTYTARLVDFILVAGMSTQTLGGPGETLQCEARDVETNEVVHRMKNTAPMNAAPGSLNPLTVACIG